VQLRHRLVLLAAGTVGLTVLLASIVCYLAMRAELRGQVDDALAKQAQTIQRAAQRSRGPRPHDRLPQPSDPGDARPVVQLIGPDGGLVTSTDPSLGLLPAAGDRAVAERGTGRRSSDREVGGVHLRTLTVGVGDRGGVQLARSLRGPDATLTRLRYVLALLVVLGTLFAVVVARAFARKVIEPVREIDDAAEHISATQDLTRRISATGDDEVGRMAQRFNAMLDTLQASRDALAGSVTAQRQLVADASHELRTPITSLRTNIELLLNVPDIDDEERHQILADVRRQAEELSELIAHIIELGRGDQPIVDFDQLHLDEVVTEVVERMRRHMPHLQLRTDLQPTRLDGDADRLARAVSNLLENAAKHGDAEAGIDVTLRDGVLTVRNHGPGVPDTDKAHVFDRFYRGSTARTRPGSGLGLAIVQQAAEAHGGTVDVVDAGARFTLRLPGATPIAQAR
jgi:two-component system sensor histidine kinase MprB